MGFVHTWNAACWLALLSTREELRLILILGAVASVSWEGLGLQGILGR